MTAPIVILGAGGHGRVVLDVLKNLGYQVLGFTDRDPALWGKQVDGINVLGSDEVILNMEPKTILLAVGIGGTGDNRPRQQLFESFALKGYVFPSLVHPRSSVSQTAILESGSIVMAGAVIQAGTRIGCNVIINTGAIVDHDCRIGDHAHIAPGAVLSGGITVGSGAHIGTGAAIVQGTRIGSNALVAAGAVVVKDVAEGLTVTGVPARARGGWPESTRDSG